MTIVRKLSLLASTAAATALAFALPATAGMRAVPGMDEASAERAFDAQIDPAEMSAWMKQMASEPNHVGSPHDKANAEFMLAQFKSWGWDAHIEEFEVLYPTPISEALELVAPDGSKFSATLTEAPIPGDPPTEMVAQELPAYVAYQGDGDVTAPLVYVNYGMPDDYKALERLGVDVKGKIVIARYGAGWRGLKPKLAQEHGAVGCIIYSDPKDDGYYRDDPYPKGGERPPNGFQRGSVQDMTKYPGDPLTPGVGATKDAKRLTREEATTILKIPTLPISYGDAQHFLAALDGPVAPADFRGALPITYHVGGATPAMVHIAVKSDWSLKTIYDTVAMIKGSEYPDQWVLRGNHHDGWVFGAADPLSGNVAEMEEAKAIGGLVKQGWRPKRTIVYLGWDGEEPGLLGSTEFAETHEADLRTHGVLYLNTDGNSRGFFGAEGSPSWTHMVNAAAADVTDPETGATVEARARARAQVEAAAKGANEEAKRIGKIAAGGGDLPMGDLGSGSDYSSFFDHDGIAAMNFGFGGEAQTGGSYHSAYDTFEHYRRFDDPGFIYAKALAQTVGRVILRAADAPVIPVRFTDAADTFARYNEELHKLVKDMREHDDKQSSLLSGGLYKLAEDPLKPEAAPTPETPVQDVAFAPLDAAIAKLKTSAAAYDAAIAAKGMSLSPAAAAHLNAVLQSADDTLLSPDGLPGRPWYRNMIYAPGVLTGYGSKTLPGVREAIEGRRWDEASKYAAVTAQAIDAYAAKVDEATAAVNGGAVAFRLTGVADSEKIGKDWGHDELDLIVADYFAMLALEQAGQSYVKSHHSHELMAAIGRTHRSVEFKHMNISAVLAELGYPTIKGYKPKENYQGSILDAIERHLAGRAPNWTPVEVYGFSDAVAPFVEEAPPLLPRKERRADLERLVRKFDAGERDFRNRALGKAGEETVFHFERRRLQGEDRPGLAKKVRWVAQEDGDGAGFDVLSFERDGRERLIEVKTTLGPRTTPFYLSRNEYDLSKERVDAFRLMRVHSFARDPRMFELKPPLTDAVLLSPSVYQATFD